MCIRVPVYKLLKFNIKCFSITVQTFLRSLYNPHKYMHNLAPYQTKIQSSFINQLI